MKNRPSTAEAQRLRNALQHVKMEADVIGDSPDSDLYIRTLDRIWEIADKALGWREQT